MPSNALAIHVIRLVFNPFERIDLTSSKQNQLTMAKKRVVLHVLSLIACIGIFYALRMDYFSSKGEIKLFAMIVALLCGINAMLKLIGNLVVVVWETGWQVKRSKPKRKRTVELWGSVVFVFLFGIALVVGALDGLYTGTILFPLSRHTGLVAMSVEPIVYWISELIWWGMGVICAIGAVRVGWRLWRGLPLNPNGNVSDDQT